MKRMMAILALASLPALAACGRQPTDTNVTANDINRLGTAPPESMTMPENETLPGNEGANASSTPQPGAHAPGAHDAAQPRPKADATPSPHRETPAPPRASPPPVDPHAGHDMGNMSGMNMSH